MTAKHVEQETRDKLIADLVADIERADLGTADKTMLDYVLLLTHRPHEIRAENIERLRDQGFGDQAIHDICAIAAYFAFVNRIADGLGVELEGE